jgi:predicted ester cyclase
LKQYGEATQVYNTDKNWIYLIELINRQAEAEDSYEKTMERARSEGAYLITDDMIEKGKQQIRDKVQGYRIQRYSQFGEIPNFDFYIKSFADEYA